jgi:hypothetical protein
MQHEIILNPESNRFIRINGPKYARLVKEGVLIDPNAIKIPTVDTALKSTDDQKLHFPKEQILQQCNKIVKKHKKELSLLNEEDTSSLLRKLLIERLIKPKKEPAAGRTAGSTGTLERSSTGGNKKTKSKYIIKKPMLSENDSESDSESDSDSD